MKPSVLATLATLLLVLVALGTKMVLGSKTIGWVFEGFVFIGLVLGAGAFVISYLANRMANKSSHAWLSFLGLSAAFGITLGCWNIWALSNDMTVTVSLVVHQLGYFLGIGLAVGGVGYVVRKLCT